MFFDCNSYNASYNSPECSLISTETIETRREASAIYKKEIDEQSIRYLQTWLCSTPPSKNLYIRQTKKSFDCNLSTPFGDVKIRFIFCPKQGRYRRYVPEGGSYNDLLKRLDSRYKEHDRRVIYKNIFNYLTSDSVSKKTNPWNQTDVFTSIDYQDEDLAYFCAILAVCDPCFGEGENGGYDIRAVLRSEKCQNGCEFKNFLNPRFYPLSQKKAYEIHRKVSTSSSIHALEGTRRGINNITADFSSLKRKAGSRLDENSKLPKYPVFDNE